MESVKYTLVVLNLPTPVPEFMTYGKHIVQAMTDNAWFPSPTPQLPTVLAHIEALDGAQTTVKSRVKGASGARNIKLRAAKNDLRSLRGYVQTIVDANPAQAEAIIQSSGMSRRQVVVPFVKRILDVAMGPSTGIVVLRAKSTRKRTAYEWQCSTDGGQTWVTVAVTSVARAVVSGLVAGKTHHFRFRATTGTTVGDWSQVVSFLVH